MKKITYYIGILPTDSPRFWDFVHNLNEDSDASYHVTVKNEYDDPYGYYTYCLIGTWESYKCFLDAADGSFIKSVEHFEED
jgi:hypothetical protein